MKTSSPFLNEVIAAIRVRHYSIRTEQAYVGWVRRFFVFHGKRHPAEMGVAEVGDFLTHLAVTGNVAASTQNQALNALLIPLQRHLSGVKNTHEKDLLDGYGQVWLPHALA